MTDGPRVFGGSSIHYTAPPDYKDEELHPDWVRTLRPCPHCRAQVTYIDEEKVWHCQKCGWRSEKMAKYTYKELETIKSMYSEGKSYKEIGAVLHRSPDTIYAKIKSMRKAGEIESKEEKTEKPKIEEKQPEIEEKQPKGLTFGQFLDLAYENGFCLFKAETIYRSDGRPALRIAF